MQGGSSIGFIGLGLMGLPMTLRLLGAGYAVSIWNRTPTHAGPAIAEGAALRASPAEVVADADILFVCLTDAAVVEDVTFGPGGIAHGAGSAKILVDLSTTGPAATVALASRLRKETGMRWVDSPVTGGPGGARDGSLVIFAGGDAEDVEMVRPVAAHLCRRFVHMGPLGAGQTTKVCNQMMVGCTLVAMAEMLTMAEAAGVDVASLPGVLEGGYADSTVMRVFGPRMVERDYDLKGRCRVMLKDFQLITEVAAATGCNTPMVSLAGSLWWMHVARGHGDEDSTTLMKLFEREHASPRTTSA